MQITLNGQAHELAAPVSIERLLQEVGLGGKPVVVELNLEAIFPRDFPATQVNTGDRVEIVTLAAGG
ncbi:sulfur carrier protein ThiS [Luteolibacter sp. LG18]|uniref:sulfur carrier protein ThiS n=1 Tax=Luteolibacter sp. LG18 TaxID=2819286 RepID=UPI002B2BE4D8|nr:sulfur carrier protein ThiS [Luteolibacter sp. LG18]